MKFFTKLITLLSTSFLLLLTGCTHTTEQQDVAVAPAAKSLKKHNLWEIKGKTNSVYLLGSIHVLNASHYPLPEAYIDAFNEAEKVVFEIDMDGLDQAEMTQATQQLGLYLDGSKLSDHVSADEYAKISALAAENRIPQQMLDVMEPWLAYLTLTVQRLQQLGYTQEYGIDTYFVNKALENNKDILELETAIQQLEILDSVAHTDQVKILIDTLQNYTKIEEEFKALEKAWATADGDALDEFLIEEMQPFPSLYNELLTKRNINWVEQIIPMLKDQDDYLIVAGVAHMHGPDGLVELLRKRGYTITQL